MNVKDMCSRRKLQQKPLKNKAPETYYRFHRKFDFVVEFVV